MQPMSGRTSAATELALRLYVKGANVYRLAQFVGIAPTTLYRALKQRGMVNGKKRRRA